MVLDRSIRYKEERSNTKPFALKPALSSSLGLVAMRHVFGMAINEIICRAKWNLFSSLAKQFDKILVL